MTKNYRQIKNIVKKTNIQKDWGEFKGARIFSPGLFLSKKWQEIQGF
jgi:hypothetical protein